MASRRPRTSIIWDFFEKKDAEMAQCRICVKEYSHKSTSNLKKHLDSKHPTALYDGHEGGEIIESLDQLRALEDEKPPPGLSPESVDKLASSDDDERQNGKHEEESDEEPTSTRRRRSDMWHHFRRVNKTLAECSVCRRRLSYATSTTNLRKHWIRKHGLRTDSHDRGVDVAHHDLPPSSPLTEVFLKGAPPPVSKRRHRRASSARKERYSTDSEDIPKKLKRKQRSDAYEPPDDEIDHFGRYVTALLKKLPRALSSKMQVDIVTLIMKTQMQHELTQTSSEANAVGTSGDALAFDGTVTSHST